MCVGRCVFYWEGERHPYYGCNQKAALGLMEYILRMEMWICRCVHAGGLMGSIAWTDA